MGDDKIPYFELWIQMITPWGSRWIEKLPVLQGIEIISIFEIELEAIPYGNEPHRKSTTAKYKVES